jgi:hypothetical protein
LRLAHVKEGEQEIRQICSEYVDVFKLPGDGLVHNVKRKLRECHKLARANLMQTKQRRVAQQASKVNMSKFYVGNKVLLHNEKAGKLDLLWDGPYTIVAIDPNETNVVIELNRNKRIKVHVNRLKKYQSKE